MSVFVRFCMCVCVCLCVVYVFVCLCMYACKNLRVCEQKQSKCDIAHFAVVVVVDLSLHFTSFYRPHDSCGTFT